ncbi:hypothetical protein [Sinorhizobium medicae]
MDVVSNIGIIILRNFIITIMRQLILLIFLLTGLGITAVVLWHEATVAGSWRYKMIVTVETPEGLKSGSAVREISAREIKLLNGFSGGTQAHLKGEAVAVDLGHRGVLFALLKGVPNGVNHGESIVYEVFPYSGGYTSESGIRHYRELTSGRAVLDESNYPIFVTFTDLANPRTVTQVLEMENTTSGPTRFSVKEDHFEQLFGAGVRLKGVTIEMTDEPITWGIEKYIPWLPSRRGVRGALGSPPGDPTKDPTGLYLGGIEFSEGRFW